ncbi:hypothetical protein [Thioalkalivibrio sp. ALE19]|uniref:terminase small subunit-like protein n=1 Tax=Thioalkalivibrio sp. ALE19 TaxID=1266909 RepID=UPI000490EB81|nr:hypothetical protein [Thioalkalivibrio sp. ALE19]
MAAKPITRAAHATIRKAGGEAYVFGQVAEGRTLKAIAEDLGISRQILSTWCNRPQRRDALTRARQEAAGALMDEALAITDNAEEDATALQKVKQQADLRKWLAGRLSPQQWGDTGPGVQVNIGQLHLDALRQVGRVVDVKSEPEGGRED